MYKYISTYLYFPFFNTYHGIRFENILYIRLKTEHSYHKCIVTIVTSGGRSPSDWVVSIQNKQLMVDPHCETGSQDVVVISAASESLITLHEVTALRFLLRQPSPNWKNFNINGITVM